MNLPSTKSGCESESIAPGRNEYAVDASPPSGIAVDAERLVDRPPESTPPLGSACRTLSPAPIVLVTVLVGWGRKSATLVIDAKFEPRAVASEYPGEAETENCGSLAATALSTASSTSRVRSSL